MSFIHKYHAIKKRHLLGLVIILLTAACNPKPKQTDSENQQQENDIVTFTDAQFRNAPIETTQLSEKKIATTLKLNGIIDVPPQSLVSVSVPLGGYLKNTQLLPGMHVRKGETIATLEDPQYVRLQQDYLQTQSKLQFATLDYNRQKELNASQASSDKVTQQAQAEMSNLQIQLNALAQQLKLININPEKLSANNITKSISVYSTIDGYVSKVNVNIGKYVNPSEVLFELINPDDIHLNLRVYEKDIHRLEIGQHVTAYTNTEPNQKYTAEIILISKDIEGDGAADVHCHFHQYSKTLLPGMYMNAEVELQTSFAQALPEESIISFEGKDYVFVTIGKQQYEMQPVEIGEKENGFVQVRNYDAFKDKNIVTKNAYTLLMKLKNTEEEE